MEKYADGETVGGVHRLFLPDIYSEIDWKRGSEFLEQEMRAITRKTRRGQGAVDKLVKVWLRDGTEKWVLIHIEIQSQEESGFPFRMFRYYFRGRDLFPERSIACLAVLGDDNANWKPDRYADALWHTSVDFRFRVVKLKEYTDRLDELEQSANPFARFVLAHLKTVQTQGDYETRMQWKIRIIQGLYDMGVPEEEIGQLYHDFDWLLTLPEPLATRYHKTMTRFEEERTMPHLSTAERIGRREGRKEGKQEGREEGRQEGREEGRQEGRVVGQLEEAQASLLEIIEARAGTVAPEMAARVAQIHDLDRLRTLRKLLLGGAPLTEIE